MRGKSLRDRVRVPEQLTGQLNLRHGHSGDDVGPVRQERAVVPVVLGYPGDHLPAALIEARPAATVLAAVLAWVPAEYRADRGRIRLPSLRGRGDGDTSCCAAMSASGRGGAGSCWWPGSRIMRWSLRSSASRSSRRSGVAGSSRLAIVLMPYRHPRSAASRMPHIARLRSASARRRTSTSSAAVLGHCPRRRSRGHRQRSCSCPPCPRAREPGTNGAGLPRSSVPARPCAAPRRRSCAVRSS